ncbi:MAG: HPF/RaiA family ribosome-associated protein [Candidatus Acidiferrales bacterium]
MKITYSNIQAGDRKLVEDDFVRHVQKLNRLLGKYAPDLVLLHSSLEKTPRKSEFAFSLHLTLPTGTLYATGLGSDVRSSAKAAFVELERQVKKHQQKLRKDYVWKRKRARRALEPSEAPSAD